MQAFRAHLIHSPERGRIERIEDALVSFDDTGQITSVAPGDSAPATMDLRARGVLLPGLIDLHIHAPQFPQLGTGLDLPLEDWLFKYTFPLEARFANIAYARGVHDRLVRRLLANGTTTAVYFATIHDASCLDLARTCLRLGQRAFVGRVAMDLADSCPEYYRDADAAASVSGTARFIEAVRALPQNALVEPIITPRFIPACSDAALEGLGALAAETGAAVQTHCSESDWEHAHVLSRTGKTDTAALDSFGLLNRRTVLAHAGHITGADMELIAGRGAGIAHCPLSNAYFGNAVFPLRRALAKALHIGLGTDISGGHSAFLLDNARAAVTASRMLEDGTDPEKGAAERGAAGSRIDFRDAFYLATKGGAEVLDLPAGAFEPGRQMDAILVDLQDDFGPPEDLLQKIIMRATPDEIVTTWVAGRAVSGKDRPPVQSV
ncbi:amidohydrolase family protein [uncultured Roseobacter sp.]|uniref:amidohydrolase family protein n=1 Tax=uncultured Roseobacter sp. TaxID=114847 RepID=UPI00261F768C|nr:amidohydrolase family protein [uncultured Roseobacter sp.]